MQHELILCSFPVPSSLQPHFAAQLLNHILGVLGCETLPAALQGHSSWLRRGSASPGVCRHPNEPGVMPVQDDGGRFARLAQVLQETALPGISFDVPGRLPLLSILAVLNPLSRCWHVAAAAAALAAVLACPPNACSLSTSLGALTAGASQQRCLSR